MSGSKAIQYPPQTGEYAVKVKNGAGWRAFNTARLQISVGQAYHEEAKMSATLDWVKHRFDKTIICVNDTLQRFNFEFEGMSPEKAQNLSEKLGREWVQRHIRDIQEIPNAEIHSWDEWKARPDFSRAFEKVNTLYWSHPQFQEAIDQNISDFWQRKADKRAGDYDRFKLHSKRYLLEETAVFSLMFKDEKAVDVYPGSVLLPCVIFQGQEVEGAPEGLGQGAFTRIDFKRLKTQQALKTKIS